jgi:branched-chain amino acid transport system permease protein
VTGFRPGRAGVVTRIVAGVALVAAVLVLPVLLETTQDLWLALAAIYAIIGLSVNLIIGHAGQISLGHQAFVGIGAFSAAFVVRVIAGFQTDPLTGLVIAPDVVSTSDFWIGLVAAGATGTVMAVLLGLVALRIRGLYLALITLSFGLMAETTIFNWRAFTGGGAGAVAPRPAAFASNQAYAYVCLAILAVFVFLDWRLTRSRAGRAMAAFRANERIAATIGVNVTSYKLLAFAASGFLAGVAGGLFGHWNQAVQALDFDLRTALVWVLMAVVGGLGSRAGVVIGSAFFAVFPLYLSAAAGGATISIPGVGEVLIQTLSPFLGALLLLLTITLYPGGIGQQLLPIRRWLAGGPLVTSRHEALRLAGLPALMALAVTALVAGGDLPARLGIGAVAGVAAGVLSALLLLEYLRQLGRRHADAAPTVSDLPVASASTEPARQPAGGIVR